MISTIQQAEFENRFQFIKQCSPEFVSSFYSKAQYAKLPAASSICEEGQHCAQLAMVLHGVGRVYKLSASGREVTLYRIYSGESCVLTASCIMNGDSFPAMAVTETTVRAILIPPANVVEEVAFKRIDVRLAEQFSRALANG